MQNTDWSKELERVGAKYDYEEILQILRTYINTLSSSELKLMKKDIDEMFVNKDNNMKKELTSPEAREVALKILSLQMNGQTEELKAFYKSLKQYSVCTISGIFRHAYDMFKDHNLPVDDLIETEYKLYK